VFSLAYEEARKLGQLSQRQPKLGVGASLKVVIMGMLFGGVLFLIEAEILVMSNQTTAIHQAYSFLLQKGWLWQNGCVLLVLGYLSAVFLVIRAEKKERNKVLGR